MDQIILKPRLSPVMLFVLLLVTLSGLNFLVAPYDVAKACGPSAYWAVMGTLILLLPVLGLMILFKNRFPDENLFQVAPHVIGKPLAIIGNLIFISVFIIWLVTVIPNATYLLSTYLFDRTPLLAIMVSLLLAIGYIAINGLKAVNRMAAFVFIPTLSFTLLMKLLTLQGITVTHLLPLFSNQPLNYLKGAITTLNQFVPLGAVFLIYPLLKKQAKLGKITLGVVALEIFLLVIGVITTIGTFGASVSTRFIWPNLASVHRLSIPYLVLEQIGLLFIIVWLTMFIIGTSFYFSLIAGGLKEQFPVLNYRYTAIALLILVGGGGFLLFPNIYRLNSVFTALRHVAIIPVIFYPLLIYIIALLRGKGVKRNEA